MSSAAVQATGPPISNRSYQQSSPHGRDQYYSQQSPTVASSPSASRKSSRRPGGNGASPNTPTTPQNHYSPAASTSSNLTTPRQQLPPTTNVSPVMTTPVTASYNSVGGPSVPPRTSSHRNNKSSASSSNPQAHPSPKDSPRQQTSSSSRSKHSPAQPVHSRSATAVGQTPVGTELSREASNVISRLVITDPQEDIAREEARIAESRPAAAGADVTPRTGLGLVGSEGVDDGGRGAGKSRQDHSRSENSRKHTKFGDYILGQTLGEGEFGKVKMGWKKDGGVEVAIKLIRRENLGSNTGRIAKIHREISILRGLEHPNIVRLHEMVETERHIGIILEYASGGELFDYILNHRYLKDNAARRLFAQLISGVGYLHKKGIVHRDLKLENLLLDRNRNIIITDFGFANTFRPDDELGEEIEYNLGNRDFVKKMGLEGTDGNRRGDLMQTSCGSPCYAAPELVVSDSLYTGRKVDVWSCGVILYAMLAGYLPFDDDPANPEGDNINLLYKYIVSTPLTFPEYVTPHARDLLKRILVPDPRKRADLFEVARHSWLSDYAHVVALITSTTTSSKDIANTTVPSREPDPLISSPLQPADKCEEDAFETPTLARSASVREPGKPNTTVSPVGGLAQKHGHVNRTEQPESSKSQRDNKRRTVQVEYVAPQSQTQRGESSPPVHSSTATASGSSRTRVKEPGPVEVPPTDGYQSSGNNPRTRGQSSAATSSVQPPTSRNQRSVSDSTAFGNVPATSAARPSTGGTLGGGSRLPSRGNSYGQPAAASVAQTHAEGHFSQPRGKQYSISAPIPQPEAMIGDPSIGRPSTQRVPSNYQQGPVSNSHQKGHKRSSTVSETLGRVASIFSSRPANNDQGREKQQRSYPPTSMAGPMSNDEMPRQSTESNRRTSFGFNRKPSDQSGGAKSGRRFSLIPAALSRHKTQEAGPPGSSYSTADPRRSAAASASRSRPVTRPQMAFGRGESRSPSQSTTGSTVPPHAYDGQQDRPRDSPSQRMDMRGGAPTSAPAQQTHFNNGQVYPQLIGDDKFPGPNVPHPTQSYRNQPYRHTNDSEASEPPAQSSSYRPQYPAGFNSYDSPPQQQQSRNKNPAVLQKSRKFGDAYDEGKQGTNHSGSSAPAKRVMDFFRRTGKQRGTKADR
ncbi:Pkinase-domain-containing protein [Lophium mytilinum]|uniref:non-specific serine/threonine protein kinase n=1 Tax=Lophium mytilinum TaxID=390894 RepID=A0A6A6QP29_9PEZI|nr:Pkinase-domain-containing protein [Lophium mytilinum]